MEQQVILDDKSFKALSAESRVSILKNLQERRMTLSELSKRLHLETSTVKEHCTVLEHADLVTLIDEGRKWKYYELTIKGKKVLMPSFMEEVKVLIVLCIGLIIFGGIIFMAIGGNMTAASYAPERSGPVLGALDTSQLNETTTGTGAKDTTYTPTAQAPIAQITDYGINMSFLSAIAIFTLILGVIFGWGLQRTFTRGKR